MRFADPTRCPDCRAPYVAGSPGCSRCGLPLRGDLARQLFSTLREADDLLGRLRASVAPPAPAPVPVPVPVRVAPPVPPTTGILESGVPGLLLGLGAACLLVGALVFLAIAWALLGVGGRTALVGMMTVGAAAGTVALARRGLRAGAESFTCVTLGLVLLVVGGADAAGWWGDLGDSALLLLMGGAVVAAGLGLTEARRGAPGLLTAAQLGTVLGGCLATLGAASTLPLETGLACGTAGFLVLAAYGAVRPARLLCVLAAGAGAATWALLAVIGAARAVLHLDTLWSEGDVVPLLVATALAAAPAVLPPTLLALPHLARAVCAGAAGATLTVAVVVGLHAVGPDAAVVGWSLALLVAAAAAAVVPPAWRVALLGPGAVSALVPLVVLTDVAGRAAGAVLTVPRPSAALVRLDPVAGLLDRPWVVVVAALALAAALVAVLGRHVPAARGDRGDVPLTLPLGLPGVVSGVVPGVVLGATLLAAVVVASYPVPLLAVVLVLLVPGATALARAATHGSGRSTPWWALAAALTCLAAIAATPAPSLLLATLVLAVVACVAALLLPTAEAVAAAAGLALAPAVAGTVLVLGDLLGADPQPGVAVATLLLALLLALVGRVAVEVGAATTAVVLAGAAATLPAAGTWLAVDLTVLGVGAGLAALLRADRRPLAWVGGGLLVLASWARLADTGVTTPEAYTLPAALVLLAVGVLALLREPRLRTTPTLLGGLLLALTPSLLAALAEPASLRGLLLAVACLGLVLGGAGLRWSAPLLAGAVTGSLLLLRALAPYAALVPPYLVMLLAGAALVTVGVTWESRLRSLRRGHQYVARLR
ncbi:hypothetical protein INN71_11720 [Nocardioides sp. ChNu-153]|uniref:SCO7613 C-terminal domain-containing membrane protein n=1 Tax=Nocardioides sp. ChNu-153 TaxID=2779364 RepID=UPI00264F5258|nr:hypothetical protein [Nocardioides sp. ChNu-153]MDN7122057.1 hypothetical protein [Nocardioides sp. ChNu-153]